MPEEQVHNHEHNHTPDHPHFLVFIIDGEVVDTLRVHERLGAILLSNPLIIDAAGRENEVVIGGKYNEETGEFSND